MALSEQARNAVAVAFPDKGARDDVLTALERYRGPERERIRRAILALAGGNAKKVTSLVAAAAIDYRDILYWAEYPEDSGTATRAKRAKQYRDLGLAVPPHLR